MHFDFELFLFLATVISGGIWLADIFWFAPRRVAAGRDEEPTTVEYARSIFPVILVIFLLRSFVAEPFRIPSSSMLPTLEVGDFILVNKYEYGVRLPVLHDKVIDIGEPERGDVVVFRYPVNQKFDYIKRVVGLPGDRIIYRDKQLTINGEPVEQRFLEEIQLEAGVTAEKFEEFLGDSWHELLKVPGKRTREGGVEVPEGHYFVMGDNRDNSNDSRVWGFVPEENLAGRAFFIWMNWDFGEAPKFDRIGTTID
ncbi:MAG: signal peptidase I [Gammaproteobacteria bacterium]|nr:signal peptidase I [Gammaproteobacteria bacterium]